MDSLHDDHFARRCLHLLFLALEADSCHLWAILHNSQYNLLLTGENLCGYQLTLMLHMSMYTSIWYDIKFDDVSKWSRESLIKSVYPWLSANQGWVYLVQRFARRWGCWAAMDASLGFQLGVHRKVRRPESPQDPEALVLGCYSTWWFSWIWETAI